MEGFFSSVTIYNLERIANDPSKATKDNILDVINSGDFKEIYKHYWEDRKGVDKIYDICMKSSDKFEELPVELAEARQDEIMANGPSEKRTKFIEANVNVVNAKEIIDDVCMLLRLKSATNEELGKIAKCLAFNMCVYNKNSKTVRELLIDIQKELFASLGYVAA